MKLNSNDKKILETLFRMKDGYVLDFSNSSMSAFFEEEFGIAIYDEKYDIDFASESKANRLRGIWLKEDEQTVGKIIFSLVDLLETDFLVKGGEIPQATKELAQKAREISARLILPHLMDSNPDVDGLKKKTLCIKGFNAVDFQHLETNKKIYLLKVLYSYYAGILTAYYGSGLFFLTNGIDNLNDYFKILRKRMIEVVESDKTFLELTESDSYNKVIIPITSLYSCTDYLDGMWEDYTQPALISLREEIADKDLFENYSEIHKTDVAVSLFLEAISGEIDTMNKYLAQKERNFHNALPNEKTVLDGAFKKQGEKEVVYHKHSHHFENSAQEKGIDLNHTFTEEGVVVKNKKKIALPKFPPTEWSKVEIRFISETDVYLKAGEKSATADYEGLGFRNDKNGKPNTAWHFMLALAKNGGETPTIPSPVPDAVKNQKRVLSDRLKTIFKNDTDPFHDFSETHTYKIKLKLLPPVPAGQSDELGVDEYLEDTMTSQYEKS